MVWKNVYIKFFKIMLGKYNCKFISFETIVKRKYNLSYNYFIIV